MGPIRPRMNPIAPKPLLTTPRPTALQKHVMFFDGNADGTITRQETKAGLQSIGLNAVFSYIGALFIHLGLRQAKGPGTTLLVSKIDKAMHGSDSGAYDEGGRLVQKKVEGIFGFDTNHTGSMTAKELAAMKAANKTDTAGALASKAEFGLLLKLAADTTEVENGKTVPALSKARLQALYDGDLFAQIAAERKAAGK